MNLALSKVILTLEYATMNDLFIQTLNFTLISLFSVLAVFLYFNKNQSKPNASNTEIASLKAQLSTKIEELSASKDDNASISADLVTAHSSIQLFSVLEVKYEALKQQHKILAQSLFAQKIDNSRLKTQAKGKSNRVNQLDNEVDVLRPQVALMRRHSNMLASDKLKLSTKYKSFDGARNQLASLECPMLAKSKRLTDLKNQLTVDKKAKKTQQATVDSLEIVVKGVVKEVENTVNKAFKEQAAEISPNNNTPSNNLLAPFEDQVHRLKGLNKPMRNDATALTHGLKNDKKKQTLWGEYLLANVLQDSGLHNHPKYDGQDKLTDNERRPLEPKVMVHLLGENAVVVDSSLSLTAYDRYYNADNDVIREHALKEHINSIKCHIKQITSKNYQDVHSIDALDYVLMFIPIEPAFNLAITHDDELIKLALEKNILLVSPTNLMSVASAIAAT